MNDLAEFWAEALSEDEAQVRQAWAELNTDEAAAVHAHLERMAADMEYAPAQRQAARYALNVVRPMAR